MAFRWVAGKGCCRRPQRLRQHPSPQPGDDEDGERQVASTVAGVRGWRARVLCSSSGRGWQEGALKLERGKLVRGTPIAFGTPLAFLTCVRKETRKQGHSMGRGVRGEDVANDIVNFAAGVCFCCREGLFRKVAERAPAIESNEVPVQVKGTENSGRGKRQ